MLADLILETTNAPGSSATITLLGAAAGRRSFNAGFGVGPSFYFVLSDGANFEWGIGSLASSTSLNRTTILGNSLGTTARIVFNGLTNVYNTLPSAKTLYRDTNGRLQMASQRIEGLAASTAADHATRRDEVMLLSGGTMTGRLALDANFYAEVSGGAPLIALDANDYLHYNRTSNTLTLVTSSAGRMTVSDTDAILNVPLTLNVGVSSPAHAARRDYVDTKVAISGSVMTGDLTVTRSGTGAGNTGAVYVGTGGARIYFDGSKWDLGAQTITLAGSYTSSGSAGLIVNGYAATSVYTQTIWQGNPNYETIYTQTLHDPSVWAGIRHVIGTTIPVSYDLKNSGNAYANNGSWVSSSDGRVKSDRIVIDRPLERLRALTGTIYTRDDQTLMDGSHPRDAGLIAQDVRAVFAEAVQQSSEAPACDPGGEGFLYLNYNALTALLVEATKAQDTRIAALEARLEALEGAPKTAPPARKRRATKS